MPQVLHDAPAAVLVIDLDRQQVVYANAAAIALTGERVGLPVDIDAWSDAAGLTDLGGRPMSATTSPLSLVAGGVPVAGEPVAVHDSARRGSSLSQADSRAGEGRLLWVTGLPSRPVRSTAARIGRDDRVPAAVGHRAGRPAAAGPAARPRGDRHRDVVHHHRPAAARTTRWSGSTRRSPASPATGWTRSSAATAGCCRAPTPTPPRSRRIARCPAAAASRSPRCCSTTGGTAPPSGTRCRSRRCPTGTGEVVNFVGVQNDVTERVMVEQERRTALAEAEEVARPAAAARRGDHPDDRGARRRRRLRPAGAHRGARAGRPVRGRPARPARVDAPGGRVAVAARDGADEAPAASSSARVRGDAPRDARRHGPGARRRRPGADARSCPSGAPTATRTTRRPARSTTRLRLRSRDGGAAARPRPRAGRADAAHPASLRPPLRPARRAPGRRPRRAGRAGRGQRPALRDRARRRGDPAAQPAAGGAGASPGLQVAARYLVGMDGNQVGGDWYDVLPAARRRGRHGGRRRRRARPARGGRDGAAARRLRSYAWDGDPPGSVLDRCDQLVQGLEMAAMATAVYARLDAAGRPTGRGCCATRTPGTRRRCCSARTARWCGSTANHSPMIGVVPIAGRRPGRGAASVRCPRARCCCSTPTG